MKLKTVNGGSIKDDYWYVRTRCTSTYVPVYVYNISDVKYVWVHK